MRGFFFEGRGRFKTRTRGTGGDGERLIHALPKPALDGSRQSPWRRWNCSTGWPASSHHRAATCIATTAVCAACQAAGL